MRKNILKTMVVIGAAALILPTAVMAEWEQGERHENQEDHTILAIDHTLYGMESAVGYDFNGDGTTTHIWWTSKNWGAPLNTTPCPINLADPTASHTWEEAMGNCPSQKGGAWDSDQTGGSAGYATDDVELFGVILDDLYQSLTETAVLDNGSTLAFKKVDQVLDILFYRSNTEGEAFGLDGWSEGVGGTTWFGGIGIDQTLDQDVADISGTTGSPNGTGADRWSSDPNKLWKYDHVAQTFYQDFRLWDKGNTFGVLGTNGSGDQTASTSILQAQNYSPRMRHGMELLALCRANASACSDYEIGSNNKIGGEYVHIYTTDLDASDFAFFDQWVIQSLQDSYTYADLAGDSTAANDPDVGFQGDTSKVVFMQSYSSWMVQGSPGDLCDSINSLDNSVSNTACRYTYDQKGHEVKKNIPDNTGRHQTGDP